MVVAEIPGLERTGRCELPLGGGISVLSRVAQHLTGAPDVEVQEAGPRGHKEHFTTLQAAQVFGRPDAPGLSRCCALVGRNAARPPGRNRTERLSDQMQPAFRSLPEASGQFRVEQRRGKSRLETANGVRLPERLQVIALGRQELPRSRRPDGGIHLL